MRIEGIISYEEVETKPDSLFSTRNCIGRMRSRFRSVGKQPAERHVSAMSNTANAFHARPPFTKQTFNSMVKA